MKSLGSAPQPPEANRRKMVFRGLPRACYAFFLEQRSCCRLVRIASSSLPCGAGSRTMHSTRRFSAVRLSAICCRVPVAARDRLANLKSDGLPRPVWQALLCALFALAGTGATEHGIHADGPHPGPHPGPPRPGPPRPGPPGPPGLSLSYRVRWPRGALTHDAVGQVRVSFAGWTSSASAPSASRTCRTWRTLSSAWTRMWTSCKSRAR